MPKIEIEVLFKRIVTEEGSSFITVDVPEDIAADEDALFTWVEENSTSFDSEIRKAILKEPDIDSEDEEFEVNEVNLPE